MLAKLNVPTNSELGPMAAMIGKAHSGIKEKWESGFDATFHMSHTRAGMSIYKKALPGTTVEVVDGNTLPVEGYEAIDVDLDQPGSTTNSMRMVAVVYVPKRSRNLLSTLKAVEQWGKPLIYYRMKAVLEFPGENSLIFNFYPHKELLFTTDVEGFPSQGAVLAVLAKACDIMEVHHTRLRRWEWRRQADGGPAKCVCKL